MRKRVICAITALVTFGIGLGVWNLTNPVGQSSAEVEATDEPQVAEVPATQVTPFYEPGSHASGMVGKFRACFTTFTSADGMPFSTTSIRFHNAGQARRELRKRLKQSLQVVSREPLRDNRGRSVGEEIVVINPPFSNQSNPAAALIQISGANFYSISSLSLQNITKYMQDHKVP